MKPVRHSRIGAFLIAARKTWIRVQLGYARLPIGRAALRAKQYLVSPARLLPEDASRAEDFYAGQFVFAGRSLLTNGRLVFECPAPSDGFSQVLHGFSWLSTFEQSESPILRGHARMLFKAWLRRYDQGLDPIAREPLVMSERLIALITHAGLLQEDADYDFYHTTLDLLARDAACLRVLARSTGLGMVQLHAALALLVYAICLDVPAVLIGEVERGFLRAAGRAIHPDGTPKDRSAATAVAIAQHLVPLQGAYRMRQRMLPDEIGKHLRSLCAFLRMVQHPDGAVAQFHGGGHVARDLASLLAHYGHWQNERADSAPDGGFERMENQHGVLIADSGAGIASEHADKVGASTLAFEFSSRTDRLIVSCGIPEARNEAIEIAYRSEAAHSSMMLDDLSMAKIEQGLTLTNHALFLLHQNAAPVAAQRSIFEKGQSLVLGHAGYEAEKGYRIERHLHLFDETGALLGLDRILPVREAVETCRLTMRFHLHPKIVPEITGRHDTVLLRLPHQPAPQRPWIFEAKGYRLELDESRCFEHGLLQVRAMQIVFDVVIAGETEIAWRLAPMPLSRFVFD
jgi:uncharacterized heparinase superfamily protein